MAERKKRKKETKKRAKGGGSKKKYGEETKTFSVRSPKSKIKELKEHINQKLETWKVR